MPYMIGWFQDMSAYSQFLFILVHIIKVYIMYQLHNDIRKIENTLAELAQLFNDVGGFLNDVTK